jgi:hypothetical protein
MPIIKDLKEKVEGRMYMLAEGYNPHGAEPRDTTQGRIRELAWINNLLADLLRQA